MLVLAADLVVLELEFAEQGLDDLGHALLLEHAGVLVQGQEPQPLHHLAAVAGHLGFAASGIGHPADALAGRYHAQPVTLARSEGRRVGKEWVSTVHPRWSPDT